MEGASRTALMTAQFRAAHALVDRDPIFEDPFALALADRSADEVREFLAANVPAEWLLAAEMGTLSDRAGMPATHSR